MNQTWSISVPWRRRAPAAHVPPGGGFVPRLLPSTQTRCECQRTIGPAGVGPRSPRRMLHIAPTRTSSSPRRIGKDQRLRPASVEGETPASLLRVLRVEVVNRPVGRAASLRAHLVAGPAHRGHVAPALGPGRRAELLEDEHCARSLARGRQVDGRVLPHVLDEPVSRTGRQGLRASGQLAEDWLRRRSPESRASEQVNRRDQANGKSAAGHR